METGGHFLTLFISEGGQAARGPLCCDLGKERKMIANKGHGHWTLDSRMATLPGLLHPGPPEEEEGAQILNQL